jgi:23S rRNA (pseudouridine1915-N3)-methyltransferase
MATLNPKTFAVLLDVKGEAISSLDLAGKLESWQNRGLKEISFLIGGANGVSREVAETVDISLSLSFLTFTHEMARVVLVEQLYRAYTIIKGFPYQK